MNLPPEMLDRYLDYCETVSSPRHVIAIPTAAYAYREAVRRRATRVADFGSGFTSWTLARYAAEADYPVEVISVDTDPVWLERTRVYLDQHGLTSNLMLWDDYLAAPHWHDLIIYDMASGAEREAGMGPICDRLTADGLVIFDDAQHDNHREAMVVVCSARRMDLRLVRATEDSAGRVAAVAYAPSALHLAYDKARTTVSDIYEHLPFLEHLAARPDVTTIIELGTRGGCSTLAFLHGLARSGGHLWSVDIDPAPAFDYPGWTFVRGDDLDPATIAYLPDVADVVFIDTSHDYDQTLAELNVYRWKVRPGGFIVLHDTELAKPLGHPRGAPPFPVKRAIEDFCAEESLAWTNSPNCFGLGTIEVT